MNDRTNLLTDKVNVTMHAVSFSEKDISYAKVQRNTAYIGNVIDKILEQNKVLDRETLLYAAGLFRNGILELLKTGKAVDLLETGILYIKPAGSMDTTNPSVKDVPGMKLAFTPSELALDAVKDVTVAADVTETAEPLITEVFDMSTRTSGGSITAGRTIRIKGRKLKVAGDESETGVFFAPCDSDGSYSGAADNWVQVNKSELIDNTATTLVLNVPQDTAAGSYRLLVHTAYGSGSRINKTIRKGAYDSVITVTA